MSIIIGLTGPTGAGKSTTKEVAENLGFRVIDCDLYARKATEKGRPGLIALTKAFGNEILFENGELNRKKLAEIAFSTPENVDLLNKTILPFIVELIALDTENQDFLLDAPTLFESGMDKHCDATIAVLADKEIRISRIIERDNLTINEALTRVNAGKSDDFYKSNTDFVLYNNGGETEFKKLFSDTLSQILGGKQKCQNN